MELWFIAVVTLCLCALLRALFFNHNKKKPLELPPGPSYLSSNLVLLSKSFSELEPILRDFKSKYGPIITLSFGSRPSIFVSDHSLAHQLLVQNGAVFSDRPRNFPQTNISSASYGSTWRLLRRNLASSILHPSRVASYSWARRWVLTLLIDRLQIAKGSDDKHNPNPSAVKVMDHFQYAMFCLLVLMCFGDKLDEDRIRDIERVQRRLLLSFGTGRYNIFGVWPRLGKLLFSNRLKELQQLFEDQQRVLIPLIKSRIETAAKTTTEIVAYVDTLVHLELPEDGNRKLTDKEMVSMCSEFLNAGTDTTSTALQWIMANLVKYPHIQEKLYAEITNVVGPPRKEPISEEDLNKMPYLKAVVLEGLRRHPPGHFVLPHKVTEEMEVEGYLVPKGATINFMVAEMGWDPKIWDDPMEFKPERFLSNQTFDITGSKEIKMMPFGAGRRICPGFALALLHLEFFVANLVWWFRWTAPEGDDVDLSEKQEFTVVMKNPLLAHVLPRVDTV